MGRATVEEIDALNIQEASLLAMHRATAALSVQPTLVLVDGNKLPAWAYESRAVVKGDRTIDSISAASIIAKVHRDSAMETLDKVYPGYGFAIHKGYPTKAHLDSLKALGVSPVHRRSFKPVKRLLKEP